MQVERVRQVANGRRRVVRKRAKSRNPAHMLTLGFLNPSERRHMPAKQRPRKKGHTAHRATSNARRRTRANTHHRRRSNPTRVIVMPRSNKKHAHRNKKRSNPAFFGTQATPMKLAQYIAGGLIGVTVNRALLPMLPASVTSNNMFATAAAIGLALIEWWAGNFVSKDFGSAVGFGALMNAGSQALNAFIPSVGSMVGLQGYRGVGDLVPSQPGLPFWPSSQLMGPGGSGGGNYQGMSSAYPLAYGLR